MQALTAPTVTIDRGAAPLARARGDWVAAALAERARWKALAAQLRAAAGPLAWDLQAVQHIDHVGAQLLWHHWGGRWPEVLHASAAQRQLLERVAELTPTAAPRAPRGWGEAWDRLGAMVLAAVEFFMQLVQVVGQLVLDLARLLRVPRRGPWRDISGHLYQMGATALPITALVGFLIGVVLAYLMSLQLQRFGAETFIVNILGISLIRELGPMLAAILVAGRSGSAITAQIGVMRVTEELDAMRVMGISHSYRLVMPRAIALGLAMPLVSAWTTAAALAGGIIASDVVLRITPGYFFQALPLAVQGSTLVLATAKSVVFGVLIALIACVWGMRVEPNTQSLGEGTTASVVSAITMVILVDALFAIVFRNVGFQ
ncbi:ABC transporter permease [Comamonas sp. NLF-1-9]|uniref:MlaE family ABC transporter permease n=1 Tax=Comamonas sp. NLF-1-9 TaxID=2853163 RepID=UPI001C45711E|nr:ABC transporter permease [Comamonas sp. NLF-1-9]QXL83705.1 ABC transporter permease [Comamonas sp. NLF-1-9]